MTDSKTDAEDVFARRQRWGKRVLGAAVTVVLILSMIPVGIRVGATSWLEDHGVQHAEIDNVDLNLFNGTFAIEGLTADAGLKIGRLSVDVDWWPLWSHRLFVRSVQIKGVEASLHQNEKGEWQLSTIRLDDAAAEPDKQDEAGQPWQVVLNRIDIADVVLKAKGMAGRDSFELSLPLDALHITLQKAEEGGAQWLKNSVKLGRVDFNGFGYRLANAAFALDQNLFLPAIGEDMAAGLKIEHLNLNLNGLSLSDNVHGVQLAAVERVELTKASVTGSSRAGFDLLAIQGIALPKAEDESLGSIGAVNLRGADLDLTGSYRFEELSVDALQAAVKKLKNGKVAVLEMLHDEPAAAPESKDGTVGSPDGSAQVAGGTEPVEEAGRSPVVYIDQLIVGKGSSLAYRDESLFPPFDTKMEVDQFSFSPVDPAGNNKGKLKLLLNLDKNGSLSVNGDLLLNPDNLASDLKVVLKNFDMPGLTGFVEGDFGQSIKTGQFDLDSTIKIADKKIDAKNKLVIRRLALEKAKQPGKAEQSLGMPVDMALDMLRDDRGDITLEVPISGRLDDPNVNVSDVINKALLSSMSAGAMTYAKLLLQPYGAILMAAEYAVGAAQDASKPKLTPIGFVPRSTRLSAEMTDYTTKIAALMKSKAFRLEICGVATRLEGAVPEPDGGQARFRKAEDLQPMSDEALLKLAESRSDVIMKAMQGQGIAADRLYNCRPNIDEGARDTLPRVDLILD